MNVTFAAAERTALQWPRFPYPGLRPFRMTEADESLIFYGRNAHKDEVLERLNTSQLVSVVGPSGCGKSSLVKVGVIPVLRAGLLTEAGYDWRPVEMRPGNDPLTNLATALAPLGEFDPARGGAESQIGRLFAAERSALWVLMEHLAISLAPQAKSGLMPRVLLLIDQFEEIFSGGQDKKAVDRFITLIVQFFRKPHRQLYVVLTMRTDFISQCASVPGLAEILNATQYITPVLRGEDLREAIIRPAAAYHGEVEPELVSAIIRDMGAGSSYNADHLPLMQHALLWMWQQSWRALGVPDPPIAPDIWSEQRERARLTLAHYRDTGRLTGILERHANDTLKVVTSGARGHERSRIAETMFRRISERDARSRYKRAPARMSEVCLLADCGMDELNEVVNPFAGVETSFVERRATDDPGDPLLDVSHESLIRRWSKLRAWSDEEADKLTFFRRLLTDAQTWERERTAVGGTKRRARGFLKTGSYLRVWQDWWSKRQPNEIWAQRYWLTDDGNTPLSTGLPLVRAFLDASKREHLKRIAAGMTAVLIALAAVLYSVWAQYEEKLRAEEQAIRAEEEKTRILAVRGERELWTHSQTLAANIALEILDPAHHYRVVREAEDLAYEALNRLFEVREIQVDQPFQSADYSPDGKWLVTVYKDKLTILNANTAEATPFTSVGLEGIRLARWSPTSDHLLLMTSNRSIALLFIPDPAHPDKSISASSLMPVGTRGERLGSGLFSADGQVIATGGNGSPIRLWNSSDGKERKLEASLPEPAGWSGFALSRDGARVASLQSSGTIEIDDVADGKVKRNRLDRKTITEPVATMQVTSLAFDPSDPESNRLLIAQGDEATVWNVATSELLFKLQPDKRQNRNRVSQAAYSRDGHLIATAYEDGAVRVWSAEKHIRLATLREHEGRVTAVRFDPYGTHIATAGQDGMIRIWNVDPALGKNDAHFRNTEELAAFIRQHLPLRNNSKIGLTDWQRCSLGMLPVKKCLEVSEASSTQDH